MDSGVPAETSLFLVFLLSSTFQFQNQLSSQWSQQYTASPRGLESAWRQVAPAPQASLSGGQKVFTDSGMWSSEYLDSVDTTLKSSTSTSGWADDFLGQQENFGMENTWNDGGFEQRWEEIKRDMKTEQSKTAEYIYQVSASWETKLRMCSCRRRIRSTPWLIL